MLRSSQLGKDIIVIGKARVPIIKFTSVQGGFKVDISVNMTNSIKVYPRVLQLFEQVGEETARALIMITKAFLNQRQMNEVHTGGLGSYSIICLVCSFLQVRRYQQTSRWPLD
jgi:non-canonical poly(A) RNA polymerase PAPD5/7